MDFKLRYSIFMYLFIILILYIWKPQLFKLNNEDKQRKMIYLIFLIIIISILSFYTKLIFEWFS